MTSSGSGALLIHPLCFLPYWWSWPRCHYFLQMPSITTFRQMEATMQLNNWLAMLQNLVNVSQRCKIISHRAVAIRFGVVRLVVRAQECYTLGGSGGMLPQENFGI